MAIDVPTIKALVEHELENLSDSRVRAHVCGLLVEPRMEMRGWDYEEPGQQFPRWLVLDDTEGSDTGIAFCEFGFGPRCPWGLVFTGASDGYRGIGMDSGWFPKLLDAYFESVASTALPIWRLFENVSGRSGHPISDEGAWGETWARLETLRTANAEARYYVHHSIAY
jgi:hypothetical protein